MRIADADSTIGRLSRLRLCVAWGNLVEKRALNFWAAGNAGTAIHRASTLGTNSQCLLTRGGLDLVLPEDIRRGYDRGVRSVRLEVDVVLGHKLHIIRLELGSINVGLTQAH